MYRRIILLSLLIVMALSSAQYAAADWNTFEHDPQHTSKAGVAGPSTAAVKWSYQHPGNLGGGAFRAGIAVGADGSIYTGGDDGVGYGFNPDGSIKFMTPGISLCCAPPVVSPNGDTVYYSGVELFALNSSTGAIKWHYPAGGNCCGAITVDTDGKIFVGNGSLNFIDPNNLQYDLITDPTGSTITANWVAPFGGWSAAVSKDHSTAYIAGDAALNAVSSVTGTLKWSYPTVNELETNPIIDNNGVVYITNGQSLIAIDPAMTAPTGTTPPPAAIRTVLTFAANKQISRMAYDDPLSGGTGNIATTVYGYSIDPSTGAKIWNANGEIDTINPTTGAIGWAQPISGSYGSVKQTQPLFDKRGAVYVASNDYDQVSGLDYQTHLYAFSGVTGTLMFHYSTPLSYHSDVRVPVISDSGDLYILMDGAIKDFAPASDISVAASATPSPVATGGALTYTTTVRNAGPDTAKNAVLKQIMPTDLVITSVTPTVCSLAGRTVTCNFGNMALNGAASATITGAAPGTVTTMTSIAQVFTDSMDLNTTNNTMTVSTDVLVTGKDLVETSISNPPASAKRGTNISVTDTERNQGISATTRTNTVGYYLSTNGTAKTKRLNGTRTAPILGAGALSQGTVTVTIPTNTSVGSYYLMSCADDTNVIAESNELNNCLASTTMILVQ